MALLSCARMFSSSAGDSSSLPVCLIHGTFWLIYSATFFFTAIWATPIYLTVLKWITMSITMSISLFFVLYFNVKLFHTTNVKTLYLYPHSTWSVSGAGIRTFKDHKTNVPLLWLVTWSLWSVLAFCMTNCHSNSSENCARLITSLKFLFLI